MTFPVMSPKRTYSKRRLCAVAVCLALAADSYATGDSVLCIGEDGHVTVENAMNGVCIDQPACGRPSQPAAASVGIFSGAGGSCGAGDVRPRLTSG
jgi:hypothetical protein